MEQALNGVNFITTKCFKITESIKVGKVLQDHKVQPSAKHQHSQRLGAQGLQGPHIWRSGTHQLLETHRSSSSTLQFSCKVHQAWPVCLQVPWAGSQSSLGCREKSWLGLSWPLIACRWLVFQNILGTGACTHLPDASPEQLPSSSDALWIPSPRRLNTGREIGPAVLCSFLRRVGFSSGFSLQGTDGNQGTSVIQHSYTDLGGMVILGCGCTQLLSTGWDPAASPSITGHVTLLLDLHQFVATEKI
ncbi:uncharacterized protein LOC135308216 [Passer domesticus]|uniref:uncharacterized protein LOC135308216 n=1 Tax=Passer domesticus TaxID=48849 RepID=UPI0030FE37CB